MTVSEMIDNFLVEYDRVFSLSAPSYTNAEILFFLNKSQNDLVFELYEAGDTYVLNASGLVGNKTFASPAASTTMSGNSYPLDLSTSTRYKYYLDSYTSLTRTYFPTIASAEAFKNDNILKSDAFKYEASTVNNNIFRSPKAYIDGQTLVVMVDSYSTPTSVYVEYVKLPKTLVTAVTDATSQASTSELREDYHNTIVTKAVLYADTVTNPEKGLSGLQLNKNI